MDQPALHGIAGFSTPIVVAVGLACLGVAVIVVAVVLVRRRHRPSGTVDELEQQVVRLRRLLQRTQYDYPRPTLAGLVQSSRLEGLTIRLHVAGTPRPLPDPVDLAGMRILEEALTNTLRHGAPSATVVLAYRADRIVLTVDNRLKGRLPGSHGARQGVETMRRRAAKLGGSAWAGLYQGGWRVHAELPYQVA
ncbi:hypothetical protein Skr01_36110 [Sphaerisporangium krabiense]|uniref:histidine kinase n=1 Tax=Sphaerisporangium krabiense TaxID=763782 RepID=A0A7W9DQ33_9ACTN|nr:hypothetical protein [Sphaerisporangium krabiense]MBB5626604.1 glucose-6-phosphate-specific signal transduction histidine kinase [Sphaerisporangium krabiense]GII63526.1 hypothetical protein Skr01_36110 [Sphaerisporangium krabiense]